MSAFVTLCHVMSCYDTLNHVTPCHFMPNFVCIPFPSFIGLSLYNYYSIGYFAGCEITMKLPVNSKHILILRLSTSSNLMLQGRGSNSWTAGCLNSTEDSSDSSLSPTCGITLKGVLSGPMECFEFKSHKRQATKPKPKEVSGPIHLQPSPPSALRQNAHWRNASPVRTSWCDQCNQQELDCAPRFLRNLNINTKPTKIRSTVFNQCM